MLNNASIPFLKIFLNKLRVKNVATRIEMNHIDLQNWQNCFYLFPISDNHKCYTLISFKNLHGQLSNWSLQNLTKSDFSVCKHNSDLY